MSTALVDPNDLRLVLNELDQHGANRAPVVAAATRLRASIEPTLFDDPPLMDPAADIEPLSHGRETEDTAKWAAFPRAGRTRHRVLMAIYAAGLDGRTDQELEHELNLPRPTPGNRRGELVAGGWVRDSGDRRATDAGNPAVVWVLTETGRHRLHVGAAQTGIAAARSAR